VGAASRAFGGDSHKFRLRVRHRMPLVAFSVLHRLGHESEQLSAKCDMRVLRTLILVASNVQRGKPHRRL
jgi:hypothetical protein